MVPIDLTESKVRSQELVFETRISFIFLCRKLIHPTFSWGLRGSIETIADRMRSSAVSSESIGIKMCNSSIKATFGQHKNKIAIHKITDLNRIVIFGLEPDYVLQISE
jgi:hypothetical protein